MSRRKNEIVTAPDGTPCTIEFEGKKLSAKKGEPLMVALLAHGVETASRSVKYHRPRGAFCLNGICGQCWMRVDNIPNRPACMKVVEDGTKATRENAFPSADFDVFRAADHVFAGGLDHHRLGTTPLPPLNALMNDTARRMAGLGQLSSTLPDAAPEMISRSFDLAIIGAGPAGLAAALVAAEAGLRAVLIESRQLGGKLRTRLFDDVPELATLVTDVRARIQSSGGAIFERSPVAGVYREGERSFLLIRRALGEAGEHLERIEARAFVIATGGYEQTPLFEANDLPGHYGARAFAELVLTHGVVPGDRVVIVDGGGEIAGRLEQRLAVLGVTVVANVPASAVVAARGGTHVKGIEIREQNEENLKRISCDVIASAIAVAPAFELARQAGCAVEHRPEAGGFVILKDEEGRTSVPWVFAAGEMTGAKDALESRHEGERAGRAAVRMLAASAVVREGARS